MQGIWLDVKSAMRQLRGAPGTTIAAVLTLAVGIGATSAVFSFGGALLEAAAPAHDMERLVAVWSHNRFEHETKGLVSPGDFLAWTARARSFEVMTASQPASFNLSSGGMPNRVAGWLVAPGYLEMFQWRPVVGRGFRADDFHVGSPRVLVVTDAFWRNSLGRRPDAIGQTLRIDGEPATIIGVLPPLATALGIFVPLRLERQLDQRATRNVFVTARMRPGVTIDQARADMQSIGEALERDYPDTNRGWSVNTRPLQEEFVGPQARLIFGLLAAAVLAVLLIGCVNISNLLLARGLARRGELVVRVALGAGTWRLMRQLLVECGLIALGGAAGSLLISQWTLDVFVTSFPIDSQWTENGGLNSRALMITAAAAVFATLASGLAPALNGRRVNLVSALQAAGRSGNASGRRLTSLFVAAEIAMAALLLIVSGLLTRTLTALERLEPGFDMESVLTAGVTFPEHVPSEAVARWIDEALTRARALPGVQSAGATSRLPFAGGRWNPNRGLLIEGRSRDTSEGTWAVDYAITPGLTETLRVQVLEGRPFDYGDAAHAPLVAIVNQAMARRYWPDRSPLGARVRLGDERSAEWRTVVAVVADIRNDDADQPPIPYLYMPLAQRPVRSVTLTIRTAGDPARFADPLRQALAAFDPDQALYDVRTMREVWREDLAGSRLLIEVFGILAIIALGLGGLGVWAVAAQAAAQRTREIGVRMALGARAGTVVGLMAKQSLAPMAIGLTLGLAAGLAVARVMRSILFQVSPADPLTLAGTIAVLAGVGLVATLGPALRAARLDPVAALRTE